MSETIYRTVSLWKTTHKKARRRAFEEDRDLVDLIDRAIAKYMKGKVEKKKEE